jgi:hypothetical protein
MPCELRSKGEWHGVGRGSCLRCKGLVVRCGASLRWFRQSLLPSTAVTRRRGPDPRCDSRTPSPARLRTGGGDHFRPPLRTFLSGGAQRPVTDGARRGRRADRPVRGVLPKLLPKRDRRTRPEVSQRTAVAVRRLERSLPVRPGHGGRLHRPAGADARLRRGGAAALRPPGGREARLRTRPRPQPLGPDRHPRRTASSRSHTSVRAASDRVPSPSTSTSRSSSTRRSSASRSRPRGCAAARRRRQST